MLQDLQFAIRLMRKDRGFSAVAVIVLALGIGVNATVFTLVNAVLIRGLPFRDADRLYLVTTRTASDPRAGVSLPDFLDWREGTRVFEGLAAFAAVSMNLADDRGVPELVRGTRLSANAFRLLGQQPLLGRDFAPGEDQPGAPPVVILGHTIWTNRYGADPGVLGRTLRINGEASTIIGVMPQGMKFPTNAELWTPLVPTDRLRRREVRGVAVFGRVRAGTSRSEAQAEMTGIAARLATQYPDTNKEHDGAVVETFNDRFNGGEIRLVFLALMGAVGFVLLIACANVANLMLSRSIRRAREIAVRVAVGATRWRIVRQLLLESVLLGFIGTVFGLLLALGGIRWFDLAVADVDKPYWIDFRVDFVVLGFLAVVCVLTGVVFGLAPALHVSRTSVTEVLNEGGRGSTGGRRARWMSSTMVVGELALTIVLLVGAGLMVRSFLKLYSLDVGIRTERLIAMSLRLPSPKYESAETRQAFFDRLTPRLAAIPGAESVALTTSIPPNGGDSREVEVEGRPAPAGDHRPNATVVAVTPGFFDTVGVTLRRGRQFQDLDGSSGSETVVVNDRMAAQFFPDEDAIGQRIRFVVTPPQTAAWRTIVGISPSIRHNSPQDAEPAAAVYVPLRQEPPSSASLLVRSRLEPGLLSNQVRREVQAIDQDQPVFSVRTMDELLAQMRWPFRVFGSLFAIFAFIGLVLSAVGLYAVMAYSVTQRTQEIGVRMALGAGAGQVSWLILRRGLIQVGLGVALGLSGAYVISRVIGTLLVQVTPTDPVTFGSITAILVAVAALACIVPARRATRVAPLVALRNE